MKFFFHYNKPLSKKRKAHYWSIHFKKSCHCVKAIDCNVSTVSKTNKRQPFVVMQGNANKISIVGSKVIIT